MPTLFVAHGPGWRLEIVGGVPELPPFLTTHPATKIGFTGSVSGAIKLEAWDVAARRLVPRSIGEVIPPLLFESVEYDVYLERCGSGASVDLPPIAELRRSTPQSDHFRINFGNNVGFVDFVIRNGIVGAVAKIVLEVFCRKVDYRLDYHRMRDEVSGILRNLAMAANSRTYALAAPASSRNPTRFEWFQLLRGHFRELVRIATAIVNSPHSELKARAFYVRSDRARCVSRKVIHRALTRSGYGGGGSEVQGGAMPRMVQESVQAVSYDTPVNRYFKAVLLATYQNLRDLGRGHHWDHEDSDIDSERRYFEWIRPQVLSMGREIEKLLSKPLMKRIGGGVAIRPESMVLHRHPLYARFDQVSRIVNGGLSFAGESVPVGVKQTSVLYEYWCFLKLIDLLSGEFDLVRQSIVRVSQTKSAVHLKKGRASAITFLHKATGKELHVIYNRLFNRLPTTGQQPDNVIQFATSRRIYLFDAKYRIQFDQEYSRAFGGPGPTTDDVNTMHRYRDAIVMRDPLHPGKPVSVVRGAIVLFPSPDEDGYRDHRFFRSIEQVDIGGLPFLPGATRLVENKLKELLATEYAL